MSSPLKDRLERLANPIVLKEMYQSLHSKKFLAALWLLLLVALYAYTTIYVSSAGGECGDDMFFAFTAFTYIMGVCLLPYLGFSTLLQEIRGRTIELVNITTLTSNQQVRGRLFASLVRLILLYTILGPFAVTAFLLRGIGVQTIFFVLYSVFILSVVACAVGIFFGALTSVKRVGTIARWGYLAVIAASLFSMSMWLQIGMVGGTLWNVSLDVETLVGMGLLSVLALLAAWLLLAAAANVLTFEADKCWGQTKFIVLLIVLVACGYPWVVWFSLRRSMSASSDLLFFAQFTAALLLGLTGFFWITETGRVSQRWRKRLEGRGTLSRLVAYPWLDGAGSSAIFLLLPAGVMVGSLMLVNAWISLDMDVYVPAVTSVTYLLFFGALGRGAVRLLPRRLRAPWLVRVFTFGFVGLSMMGAILLLSYGVPDDLPAVLSGLSPVLYVNQFAEGGADPWVPLVLPLLVGCSYHLGAVFFGLRRLLHEQSI